MELHLDTSFLVDALSGDKRSGSRLSELLRSGSPLRLSSAVVYEWMRGPRTSEEIKAQLQLFPVEESVPVDGTVAARAAALYRQVRSPRGREIDILIAACAIEQGAQLITLNPKDFEDIPGLQLAPLSIQ